MRRVALSHSTLPLAVSAILIFFGATLTSAQTSDAAAGKTPDPASSATSESAIRGFFPVTLTKPLDSKKLKNGDTVVCEIAGTLHLHGMLISSGSKVIGHVTQAQARSKGDSQSSLAMVFDKLEIAKGQEIPLNGTLQAIAPSLGNSGPVSFALGTSGNSGAGGAAPPNAAPQDFPAGNSAHPLLNSESKGVLGFHNLQMGDDSVITSPGKEVKLDAGTQMMIRVQ